MAEHGKADANGWDREVLIVAAIISHGSKRQKRGLQQFLVDLDTAETPPPPSIPADTGKE